jgi:hypothetical protein
MFNINAMLVSINQVAALVPDMFCNFYLEQNPKLLISQQPMKLEEKILTILNILQVFD